MNYLTNCLLIVSWVGDVAGVEGRENLVGAGGLEKKNSSTGGFLGYSCDRNLCKNVRRGFTIGFLLHLQLSL